MITLNRKQDCCGCSACASICPKHCITMKPDDEGFLYPEVDVTRCVECNACNNVCPVINKKDARTPIQCYAAKNKNTEILLKSSSGGAFSAIAEYVLDNGGVVFGAVWEDDKVVHAYIESKNELYIIRGSKYVQSDLRNSFVKVRDFLKNGRLVLFSGTPCEIGGLKSFLKKDYENLISVDVACHGAPSPKVLALYIQELKEKYGNGIELNFRSKPEGWPNYKVTAFSKDAHFFYESPRENIFMRGFLCELYSRPSCHKCAFKEFRSQSDITLADFWGIDEVLPAFEYQQGASLVIINSNKGQRFFDNMRKKVESYPVDSKRALRNNKSLLCSELPHPKRALFFARVNDLGRVIKTINKAINPSLFEKSRMYVVAFLKKCIKVFT